MMRIDVDMFKASKSQRKVIRRWQQFIDGKRDPSDGGDEGKMIEEGEGGVKMGGRKRKFEIKMEEPVYSKAKSELMIKYTGYGEGMLKSLWCKKGVAKSILRNGDHELELGTKHMCYYLDDVLVGCGVVDVLPTMITSLYFFYDPSLKKYGFGILSVLKEIEFVTTHSKNFPNFKYEHLGLYSPTHPAMLYKSQFKPFQLLCPYSLTYIPSDGHPDRQKYGDNRLSKVESLPQPISNEFTDIIDIESYILSNTQILVSNRTAKLNDLPSKLTRAIIESMEGYFRAVGKKMAKKLILSLD